MNFDCIKAMENKYEVQAYGKYDVALVSGKGAVATDSEGNELVDFASGIGVNSLGYCDEGWKNAVTAQINKLQHISNLYYNDTVEQAIKAICEATGYKRAFMGNSGAEANECAIKIARKYGFDKYGENRTEIITLRNSFHGRTVTTLAATGQDSLHKYFYPFTEGFKYVDAGDIEGLKKAADGNTCAVMMELIQGEGGVIPLDEEYVKSVAKFCNDNDILLIVDEIQTGIGRTGKLLASEHYGIKPDITTLAKGLGGGLPIGACVCGEKTADVIGHGDHGTTFGANPIACAAAIHVLSRVANEKFLAEAAEKGEYLREKISAMPNVKSVRGKGMMIGIELANGTAGDVVKKCLENGVLVITAKSLIRLLPPLTVTYDEIDRGLSALEKSLKSI